MNKLSEFFWEKEKKLNLHKWHHYFDIYDRHFKKFQGKNPIILEIGVFKGGSLEMWNYYFDNKCTIYGVDINPSCKELEKQFDNVKIFIGNQEDSDFWNKFKKECPKFDILIDDGGHTMNQQIKTYECMYHHLKDDGVYLCEDLHTSYWSEFGGGLKNPNSFIEYSKNFIDFINSYHIREQKEPFNDLIFRKVTNSIHYYDSIIVLEKKLDNNVPKATIR